MRINTGTFYRSLSGTISRLQTDLGDLTVRLSAEKRVTKPSDDPAASITIARANTALAAGAARQTILTSGMRVQQQVDASLAQITESLNNAVLVASDAAQTTGQLGTALSSTASELRIIADTVLTAANTSYAGRYLFGGYQDASAPFTGAGASIAYVGDANQPSVPLGDGRSCPVSLTGDQVFNFGGAAGVPGVTDNVFVVLQDLADQLEMGQMDEARDRIEQLTALAENVNELRGTVGAWENRLQASSSAIDDDAVRFEQVLSDEADLDLAEAITEYSSRETTYQAALGVFSRILALPNLFDLR